MTRAGLSASLAAGEGLNLQPRPLLGGRGRAVGSWPRPGGTCRAVREQQAGLGFITGRGALRKPRMVGEPDQRCPEHLGGRRLKSESESGREG